MRIMDNGQNYVQKQHNRWNKKFWRLKSCGENKVHSFSPTVILGWETAKEVTETSGSKICFARPTCSPPPKWQGFSTSHLPLFVTSNVTSKNNILLCLAILSWVQRYCSKGDIFWVTQPWPQLHLPFVIKCMQHDKSTLEFCLMTPLPKGLTLHLPGLERGVTRVPTAFQSLSEISEMCS